jgi:hypothetical protein
MLSRHYLFASARPHTIVSRSDVPSHNLLSCYYTPNRTSKALPKLSAPCNDPLLSIAVHYICGSPLSILDVVNQVRVLLNTLKQILGLLGESGPSMVNVVYVS